MPRPDSESVEHIIKMIHMISDGCHYQLMCEEGYIDRIKKQANSGAWMKDSTMEANMMRSAIDYLREAADNIEEARTRLVANVPENARVQ